MEFLEIYQEDIHDLLGRDLKARLEMKEHPERGLYVKDITSKVVTSVGEMEKVMIQGNKNRSTGATLMNKDSSRSHSIFTINVEMSERDPNDPNGNDRYRMGKLRLVDLAGSERQSKT